MANNEFEEATDGSLRVSRRHLIKAAELSKKATHRLDLDEHGDPSIYGGYHYVTSTTASAYESVDLIEDELDRRDADYRNRGDVRSSV